MYRALDIGAFNAIAEDQGLTRCRERLAVCKDTDVIVISETTQHVKRVTQTRNRYSQERNTLFVLPYGLNFLQITIKVSFRLRTLRHDWHSTMLIIPFDSEHQTTMAKVTIIPSKAPTAVRSAGVNT